VTATDPDVRELLRAYLDAIAMIESVQTRIWKAARLTLGQLRVLRLLAQEPGSLSELGAELSLSPTSTTRLIDRLEERGLVERRRAGDDRRRVVAALTEEGRELTSGLPLLGGTPISKAAQNLSPAQRKRIASSFREFVEAVHDVEKEPALAASAR
jgi:DNA-binding MarR family transcriptional regulator